MESNPIIEKLKGELKEGFLGAEERTPRRIIVSIKPDALLRTAEYLHNDSGFRFIIATAIHTRRGFEIHYHFSKDSEGMILNLHVILDGDDPKIESLSNMFNASNWIEREIHELFGIDFLNHPNQEKLISEGNWEEGVYPYRKNFKSTSDKKA